jgi:hypothetical protein
MKKYYLMAIDKDNSRAMNNLGTYYLGIGNYEQMKKYYYMAVEKGCVTSMRMLGYYYETTEKNYYEMEKYYKL